MGWFDRQYGRLMRVWAAGPKCQNPECRRPYVRGDRVGVGYCSTDCEGRAQELNAW